MDMIILILVYCVNVLASNALAYFVTHSSAEIKIKPFNCYGCMAFWLTLLVGVLIAWTYYGDTFYLLLFISALSAFLNYFYVKSKYHITL